MQKANSTVYHYLELIQKKSFIKRFGANYETENLIRIREEEKAYSDDTEYIDYKKNIKSKYEAFYAFSILKYLFNNLEKTIQKTSKVPINIPVYGTAFSREFNAYAIKVPTTNEFLIIFERELFILANQLSKILVQSLPNFKSSGEIISFNFNSDNIEKHIKENTILQKRFTDIVFSVIQNNQPLKSKQYYIDKKYERLQYELLFSLEMFVVGHEFGHICLKHLENAETIKSNIEKNEIEWISPNWQMEYDADIYGLNLLMNSIHQNSLHPFSYLGAELFFIFLDLYDRASNFFQDGEEKRSKSQSHPPSIKRRENLNNILNKYLPKEHLEVYNLMSNFIEETYNILWKDFKTKYYKNKA